MSTIMQIEPSRLKPNPYRDLATYPWIEDKIEALKASYAELGVFEGIIARPAGDDYELWFGHHRVEAAKRMGITSIPVTIRDASDEDMVKAMAHENSEEFQTDFLIQLNTWEGGVAFLTKGKPAGYKPTIKEVAELVGMMRKREDHNKGKTSNMSAETCAAAYALVSTGLMKRDSDKEDVAAAGRYVAEEIRHGRMQTSAVRSGINVGTAKNAAARGRKRSPHFHRTAKFIAKRVAGVLIADRFEGDLKALYDLIPETFTAVEQRELQNLLDKLRNLALRADWWRQEIGKKAAGNHAANGE